VRSAVPLALLVLAAGCGSGHRSGASLVIVSTSGRIGPLQMDRSGRRDVIGLAGRPEAERPGRYASSPAYRALGYGCSARRDDMRFRLSRNGPYCRTVFFINLRTGRLGDFFTTSPRYGERHGVRIGMATAKAERLLHKLVYVGCEENIHVGGARGVLTVAFSGGTPRKMHNSMGLHLIGGHVYGFALHGRRSELGIFDCM
jgi:hypothetical protein